MRPALLALLRRTCPAWLALGAALGAHGCKLPARSLTTAGAVVNTCAADVDPLAVCGPEGACLRGICHASAAASAVLDLPVVFAVTRSQISGTEPGRVSFFSPVSLPDLARADAASTATDLGLPALGNLEITVSVDPTKPAPSVRDCYPSAPSQTSDRSLDVHATLLPSRRVLGLPEPSFARLAADPNGLSPPLKFLVSMSAPPSTYDLYVVPVADDNCPFPPLLERAHTITPGTNVIDFKLTSTSPISGTIHAPATESFDGWRLTVVDQASGLRVSTVGGLVPAATAGDWSIGSVSEGKLYPLEYYAPHSSEEGAAPASLFLVLAPPTGTIAPSFAWELASVDLFATGVLDLSLKGYTSTQVPVELRVEQGDRAQGQRAGVWLRSQAALGSLVAAPDVLASYAVGPLTTTADGTLAARLAPGRYDCLAVARYSDPADPLAPPDPTGFADPFDLTTRPFDFRPAPGTEGTLLTGFTLPLQARPTVDLHIFATTTDDPVVGLAFDLVPAAQPRPFDSLFGLPAEVPRPSSGLTDAQGHALAAVDSGLHTVTVRFPPSSGYPWLVKAAPRVQVPLAPGDLRVSLPVEVQGTIRDRALGDVLGKPLAGATIQAFALVGQGTSGAFFVSVATTTVDDLGAYRLLLPSRL
jgi:hypothetical protein